jgi:DNA-binding PadR family transcriptional regulator
MSDIEILNKNDQINTFAFGKAFLERALELEWVVEKRDSKERLFFLTEKGKKRLKELGINITDVLRYQSIDSEDKKVCKLEKEGIDKQRKELIEDDKVEHKVVYITKEEDKILRKYNISENELAVLTPAQVAFSTNNEISESRAAQLISMASLKALPGIGEALVSKLYLIGIRSPEDMKQYSAEDLRILLEKKIGAPISEHIKAALQRALDFLEWGE